MIAKGTVVTVVVANRKNPEGVVGEVFWSGKSKFAPFPEQVGFVDLAGVKRYANVADVSWPGMPVAEVAPVSHVTPVAVGGTSDLKNALDRIAILESLVASLLRRVGRELAPEFEDFTDPQVAIEPPVGTSPEPVVVALPF